MTRYIAIAAVALTALTGAASAMSNPAAGLGHFVSPEVAATLDANTIEQIKRTVNGGGNDNEKRQWVNAILLNADRG